MVFAREIEGRELTFGVSGKLIRNAVVMYDHQTDTLWSQFLQEAVQGELAGQRLELISAPLTTWAAWVEEHPDTKLLDRRIGGGRRGDPYQSYYQSNAAGVIGEEVSDGRLPRKALIVGLDWGETAQAYDFGTLTIEQIVNDTYAGRDIVVTLNPQSGAQAVFDRTLSDGRVLTFEPVGTSEMRDAETGSTWRRTSGVAATGELAGTRLMQLNSFVAFWFAWTDFHPDTGLYAGAPTAP